MLYYYIFRSNIYFRIYVNFGMNPRTQTAIQKQISSFDTLRRKI